MTYVRNHLDVCTRIQRASSYFSGIVTKTEDSVLRGHGLKRLAGSLSSFSNDPTPLLPGLVPKLFTNETTLSWTGNALLLYRCFSSFPPFSMGVHFNVNTDLSPMTWYINISAPRVSETLTWGIWLSVHLQEGWAENPGQHLVVFSYKWWTTQIREQSHSMFIGCERRIRRPGRKIWRNSRILGTRCCYWRNIASNETKRTPSHEALNTLHRNYDLKTVRGYY